MVLVFQNKLSKAEPLYKQMVEVREQLFDSRHPSVATALVNWAVICSQQVSYVAMDKYFIAILY